MLPRQPLVWQRLTVTWKLWRRTTTIRFFRQADLRWLSCLWLSFALYLLIVRVTNWIRIEFNQSFALCSFAYPTSESRIIHYCITIRLLFVLPLSVGIFSYYEIFFKIHEHKQNTVSTLQNSPNSRINDSSVRDISVSRVFVAAGFLCCCIPMWALALWMRFSPETCPRVVQLIDVFLSYLSASVNPLIYTFTNGEESEGNFANFSVAATKGHGMHQTKPFQLVTRATGYWTGETNVEV